MEIKWDHSPCCHACRVFKFIAYFHMWISDFGYGTHALREVKGSMSKTWSIPELVTSPLPLETCLPWWGCQLPTRPGRRHTPTDRTVHMHPPPSPSEQEARHWFQSEPHDFWCMQSFIGLERDYKHFVNRGENIRVNSLYAKPLWTKS